jgi:hypothetical protein
MKIIVENYFLFNYFEIAEKRRNSATFTLIVFMFNLLIAVVVNGQSTETDNIRYRRRRN